MRVSEWNPRASFPFPPPARARACSLPTSSPWNPIPASSRWSPSRDASPSQAAILNPPYRKIGAASRERRLLRSVGLDATNLYAAFVALAVRLLVPGGQLVAIIPRSFCNGPYFRAFRALLLDATALRRIHVFTSRDRAFGEDGVLQENVIIHAVAGPPDGAQILVSSSAHAEAPCRRRTLPAETVIRSAAGDRFLHLPVGVDDGADSSWMAGLPCTLADLGLTVSTGRVVDFRARAHLRPQAGPGLLPLIYPCHFAQGRIAWPRPQARKPNALARHDDTEALLVPSGFYTVTKRFSSKEERRRLVAAVYDPDLVSAAPVGFENHLNYFHEQGHGLDPDLAYGLMVFLNATPIDRYFRQFNGHTQVNATDLRSLRYPARKDLTAWGRWWRRGSCGLDQAAIDAQVMARTA